MTELAPSRRFEVRARHASAHVPVRVVEEQSFEAAAVAYAEELHLPSDDADTVSVIVRDAESGHEHCFTVDLETGESGACG